MSILSFLLAAAIDYECLFVSRYAMLAVNLAQVQQMPEENWSFIEDGFTPDELTTLKQIKREAWHDIDALYKRVEAACMPKEQT